MASPIIQFGMPRTGTTFIFRILTCIFPDRDVVKTHRYEPEYDNYHVVATYRDLRAVTVSRWRCVLGIEPNTQMSELDVINHTRDTINLSNIYYPYFDSIFHIKYEDFFENFEYVFSELESYFAIKIDNDLKEIAYQSCGINSHKKISDELKTFDVWDEKTLIHGNHIYSDNIDSWKYFLDEKNQELMTEILKPEMSKWGY